MTLVFSSLNFSWSSVCFFVCFLFFVEWKDLATALGNLVQNFFFFFFFLKGSS